MDTHRMTPSRAYRTFERFIQSSNHDEWSFFKDKEHAVVRYTLDEEDPSKRATFTFDVFFKPNKIKFRLSAKFFYVDPDCRLKLARAVAQTNVNSDKYGVGFATFSYDAFQGLSATLVVMCHENDNLELVRKAYVALWGAMLARYDYFAAVANGRERTSAERVKNLRSSVGYLATFFTDATQDYIYKAPEVNDVLEILRRWEDQTTWGLATKSLEDDDCAPSFDTEGYDGLLFGDDLKLTGDGWLFAKAEDDEDEIAFSGDVQPFDSNSDDDLEIYRTSEFDNESAFNALFLNTVLAKAFPSQSDRRREEDKRLLEQDDETNCGESVENRIDSHTI